MNQHTLELCKSASLLLFACVVSVAAYADPAVPRYVSGEGEDKGDCSNVYRPCRSLLYALSVAGKFDPISVGAGEYSVRDSDGFYALAAGTRRLRAGMDKQSGYTLQKPGENRAVLVGVPPSYRAQFQDMGFRVLTDLKGLAPEERRKLHSMTQKMALSKQNHGRADCTNNVSDGFPCSNIELLSHITSSSLKSTAKGAMDIWGFVDLNTLREYVLISLSNGLAVVDVTNPESPKVIGIHEGLENFWRDVKVVQIRDTDAGRWRSYAYISTEANMGLAILDLSDLPNSLVDLQYVSDVARAHNVYLMNADFSFGTAQKDIAPTLVVAGANLGRGSYRVYGLDNPVAPLLKSTSTTGYMHDAASAIISDDRKNTQCKNAAAEHCRLLADFNEDSVDIWDMTDEDSPQLLSSSTYIAPDDEDNYYVHSGWWSENAEFLFVHDEFDERNNGLNTTLRVFDVRDLTKPVHTGTWRADSRAIDHNGFARGNRYYMSNYTEGLTVLDIKEPNDPQRIGFFDTQPATSAADFAGAWGVYPFLPSGTLAVSDINSGLFLLGDKLRNENAGNLKLSSAYFSGLEGESIQISVQRTSSEGAVSVDLELILFTAEDSDVTLGSTRVSWGDGVAGEQVVSLDLLADSDIEGVEHLAIRLKNPQGTHTGYPDIAHILLSDVGQESAISLLHPTIELQDSADVALVTFRREGSIEGPVSVDWSLMVDGVLDNDNRGSLAWADREGLPKTLELAKTFAESQQVQLVLSNAVGALVPGEVIPIGGEPEPEPEAEVPIIDAGGLANIDALAPKRSGGSGGGSGGWILLLALTAMSVYRGITGYNRNY